MKKQKKQQKKKKVGGGGKQINPRFLQTLFQIILLLSDKIEWFCLSEMKFIFNAENAVL